MIALKSNRRVLTWLCIYPADENTSEWQKRAHVAFSVFVFGLNLFACGASAVYFIKYASDDLESSLLALSQMSGCINALYINIITFSSRHKITAVIDSLSDIYKSRESQMKSFLLSIANWIRFWAYRCTRWFHQVLDSSEQPKWIHVVNLFQVCDGFWSVFCYSTSHDIIFLLLAVKRKFRSRMRVSSVRNFVSVCNAWTKKNEKTLNFVSLSFCWKFAFRSKNDSWIFWRDPVWSDEWWNLFHFYRGDFTFHFHVSTSSSVPQNIPTFTAQIGPSWSKSKWPRASASADSIPCFG